MTRKDFALIASGFSFELDRLAQESANGLDRSTHKVGLSLAARSVADQLMKSNPRFNRDKFLYACGVNP